MTIRIRQAGISDLLPIKTIDHLAQVDPARIAFIQRSTESGNTRVAEVSRRVVAYSVFTYEFFEMGFISMIYVQESHRHRGIASALILSLETDCRTDRIFTSTNESNRPMRILLDRLGYGQSGLIENLDEGDPEIVFCKFLRVPNTVTQ